VFVDIPKATIERARAFAVANGVSVVVGGFFGRGFGKGGTRGGGVSKGLKKTT